MIPLFVQKILRRWHFQVIKALYCNCFPNKPGSGCQGSSVSCRISGIGRKQGFFGMDTDIVFPNMHSGTRVTRDVHVAFHDPTSGQKAVLVQVASPYQLYLTSWGAFALSSRIKLSTDSPAVHSRPHRFTSAGRGKKSSWRVKHPETHGYLFRLSNQQPSSSEHMLDEATCRAILFRVAGPGGFNP